jgi:hypothetical protein
MREEVGPSYTGRFSEPGSNNGTMADNHNITKADKHNDTKADITMVRRPISTIARRTTSREGVDIPYSCS